MSRAIGVVTVARSDYGHLTPLLQALHAAPDVELLVYIAGSHLAARFGRTASLVEADGWDGRRPGWTWTSTTTRRARSRRPPAGA